MAHFFLHSLFLLLFPLLGLQLDDVLTNFPPEYQQRIYNAVTDCISVATFISVSFSDCDAPYLRYFPKGDADFVQQVFRRIANIPPNAQLNVNDYAAVLDDRARAGLDPRFDNLIINYGNHPEGIEQLCGEPNVDAFFTRLFSGRPCICICPDAFRRYPDLNEILNPPDWARDAQGHPLPGYGIDGLGDHDSDLFWTVGAVLMHELMHYPELLNDIPRYNDLVEQEGTMLRAITDYTGDEPPEDAYGAFNAQMLQELSTLHPDKYQPHEAVNNADNYVAYALSKFFSWRCAREFGKATSKDDNYNRVPPPRPAAPAPAPAPPLRPKLV